MTKRRPKKPSGKKGHYSVSSSPGSTSGQFQKITFPEYKDDLEAFIVKMFLDCANNGAAGTGSRFFIRDARKAQENGFDFDVTAWGKPAYLELIEAAPLERIKGGYAAAPAHHKPLEFAEDLFGKILYKSERYPKNMTRKLYLLVYVTHWAFVFGSLTLELLRHFCNSVELVFDAIFVFHPLDDADGFWRVVYPLPPEEQPKLNPADFKDAVVVNLDPESFNLELKEGAASVVATVPKVEED